MKRRLEHMLKRVALAVLAQVARRPGSAPTSSDCERVQRILVVRPDERLGNAVLVTPLVVALKGKFSRAHLVCLLGRRFWDLREFLPSADEFIPFDKISIARNPWRLWALLRRLRAMHFDLVFDASGDHEVSFTHLALTALSGGRFRIGHARGGAARFYDVAVPIPEGPRHAAEMHLNLVRAVTHIRSHPRPLLRPRPDTGFADTFFHACAWDPALPLIVIHPGARSRKQWPAESFAEVGRLLQARAPMNIALVWGPADAHAADAVLCAAPMIRPAGILPFGDFLSLVRRATVFLSGDCGPMHLAAAAPPAGGVIAIFLASDPEKYRPLGRHDRVLDGRNRCLTSEMVVDAVMEMVVRQRQVAQALLPRADVRASG